MSDEIQDNRGYWTQENALAFSNALVAAVYHTRPTYPPETFAKLAELLIDAPRNILDIGCGTGALARNLVPLADHVDAVDISAAMIAQGKTMPGGDDPKLSWRVGRAEEVTSDAPYALMTAGDSLHWMDWDVLMPRLGALLSPHGSFAICILDAVHNPWEDELMNLIRQYSVMQNFHSPDLVETLQARDLFTVRGTHNTTHVPFVQTIDDYVESFHARSSLAHGRLEAAQAQAFDNALRELLAQHQVTTQVTLQVFVQMVWGIPHAPNSEVSTVS